MRELHLLRECIHVPTQYLPYIVLFLFFEDIIRIPPIRTSTEKDIKPSDGLLKLLNSSILYEDKGLLVLNKTHGMAVHGGSGVTIGIIEALKSRVNKLNIANKVLFCGPVFIIVRAWFRLVFI